MGKLGKTARYVTLFITLIYSLINIQSCSIKEDFSKCTNEEEDFLLYIKVIDIVTGKDITESGEIENAYLYLFDYNQNFVKTYEISAEQIARREPLIFKHEELDRAMISAWGNLGEEITISNPQTGDLSKKAAVSLLQNPEETKYDLSPNDFFFGVKTINDHSHTTHIEEVVITQKNAKLHITVRGLNDKNTDNYHFHIAQKHNGYDFNGNPYEKNVQYKRKR
ncbi:MAG: FimB/Mfa2 family fimbrial subunit [Odoribacter sp.]|nr:FimB/Mfa2 family fimbrial subunit [Odoribacter sp.]